jgi:hypothetical protein
MQGQEPPNQVHLGQPSTHTTLDSNTADIFLRAVCFRRMSNTFIHTRDLGGFRYFSVVIRV